MSTLIRILLAVALLSGTSMAGPILTGHPSAWMAASGGAPVEWNTNLVLSLLFTNQTECAAGTYRDTSGWTHDPWQTNAAWRPVWSNELGGCLDFNGTSHRLVVPFISGTNFTLISWVNHSLSVGSMDIYSSLDVAGSHGNYIGFYGGNIYVTCAGSAGYAYTYLSGGQAATFGVWTQIAGTYNGSSIKLYINGTCVATNTQNLGSMVAPVDEIHIGRYSGASDSEYFKGKIREFLYYETATNGDDLIVSDWNAKHVGYGL